MLAYLLLGACAGVLAGLLGIGGGLVLVGALAWLLPRHGVPADAAMHVALASSLASIVLTAASSARSHHRRGSVLWPTVAWMVPGVLLGGWLGSRFAIGLDDGVLRWCVAGYCWIVAAQMLLSKPKTGGDAALVPRGPGYTAAGGAIGIVSAIVGIGGGSLTVPLLVWRGVAPVRAVGTSSACGIFIGIGSALGYALQAPEGALQMQGAVGYVYLPAALGVAVASVLAAPHGTRLAHALSGAALKRVFAVFLMLVGSAFAYSAL
ncbi:MAG: sulfite exporter TauE/SafE family protein [Thermomonas sp.]